MEAENHRVAEMNAKLRRDQEEHEIQLKEQIQLQEAEKARNAMEAARKALEDANELQRLQAKLKYDQEVERYEVWKHRRMMIERAARLRALERS